VRTSVHFAIQYSKISFCSDVYNNITAFLQISDGFYSEIVKKVLTRYSCFDIIELIL